MQLKHLIEHNKAINLVAACAKANQIPCYAIGGFVRDLLLDRPCKDLDFVSIGHNSGIELATAVSQKLGLENELTVYKNFGTALIKFDDFHLEFVGARKESYRAESRKPIVEDGTLEEDQKRRDFTINALSISLNVTDFGELYDPFGGVEDLKKKIIRTPLEPEITYSDDPLRMMRAIRFASQLGFDIEHESFLAIKKKAERISIISQERITEELNKIILSSKPSYGFNFLFHSGLLEKIFPEMVALHGVEVIDGKAHKDNFYHTLKVLDNVAEKSDDLWVRWAAILHDIAKPNTKRFHPKAGWTFHGHEDKGARMVPHIFRRLKLPMGEPMRFVQNLVKLHLRPIALTKETITDSAVRRLLFEAGNDIDGLMILCRADITSKDGNKVKKYLQNFDLVEKKMNEVEANDQLRNWQPACTGEDIMKVFDLKPGKDVGFMKNSLREAILDGKVKNEFEESMAFLKTLREKMNEQIE
ncbi:MAG: HD domain-containing protein [Cytophagales bacterium]